MNQREMNLTLKSRWVIVYPEVFVEKYHLTFLLHLTNHQEE